MTTNVRIKLMPPRSENEAPRAVTPKVFLERETVREDGSYCRALEPNEVVALPDEQAAAALRALPFELEVTLDPPTRPLYFRNTDEARLTSQYYKPGAAGRADEAARAMKQMLEEAQSPEGQAKIAEINELAEREARIREREIELGLIEDPDAFEKELDADLADVPASDNASSPAEMQAHQQATAAELAEEVGVDVTDVETPPVATPEAPKRRRRARAANA